MHLNKFSVQWKQDFSLFFFLFLQNHLFLASASLALAGLTPPHRTQTVGPGTLLPATSSQLDSLSFPRPPRGGKQPPLSWRPWTLTVADVVAIKIKQIKMKP